MPGDVFGIAEEEHALGLEGEVEQRQDLVLQLHIKIDQQVAARDEVDAREGGILDDAVLGEDTHLSDAFGDAVGVAFRGEPACEALGRDVLADGVCVAPGPRRCECAPVKIGCKDLHPRHLVEGRHVLAQ